MRRLRWGILSTAKIGREKVIPAIARSKTGQACAIASRDAGTARKTAEMFGIEKSYGSYDALIADPEIDAIYIPLPNHLHVAWTLKAAAAGKHVLCEKPIALSAEEAEELRGLPKGIVFVEAFMVRYHRQWLRVRELVRSGALGELRAVQCFFSYFNRDPRNVRNLADIGGGALYDIGCYPVAIGRLLFEREPMRAVSLVDRDPDFKTDRLASALLDFGAGRRLEFTVSTQLVPYQRVNAVGTKMRCEVIIPFNAPQGEPVTIRLHDGTDHRNEAGRAEVIPPSDQYADQIDAFAEIVLGGANAYGVDDAISQMRVLDALFESERTNAWANVARAP
jgi:predicted dehydrogenase